MLKEITTDTFIQRVDDFVTSELEDDSLVMMCLEKNAYYGLESVGKRIWEMLEEKTSTGKIIDELMSEFDVDKEQCEKDVLSLLSDLQKENIIVVV